MYKSLFVPNCSVGMVKVDVTKYIFDTCWNERSEK